MWLVNAPSKINYSDGICSCLSYSESSKLLGWVDGVKMGG